jgi:hypothetical protein
MAESKELQVKEKNLDARSCRYNSWDYQDIRIAKADIRSRNHDRADRKKLDKLKNVHTIVLPTISQKP